MEKLALLGGNKTVVSEPGNMFDWPIVNKNMEEAVLQVLRNRNMSGTDITKEFEKGFADWHGMKYALGHSSGTASLQAAMYGVELGPGDELICPSITYWASCTQALSLGASVVFADIVPETLCVDHADIERLITERTKAIMVVHYAGMPAEMDKIVPLAEKYGLKIIEDVSHAQGALYKGKMVGTFGDAAGFSLMSGKSFAIGEGGMLLTNKQSVYERALLFGHYGRHNEIQEGNFPKESLGIPWGGYKYRMHQLSSAVGIEQLKKYPAEMTEIDKAMNYFWDLLEDLPGIKARRPDKESGSTMGGWYAARGVYCSKELEGLSIKRFCEAVTAEGVEGVVPGCNKNLALHPIFNTLDVYGHGKATQNVFRDGANIREDSRNLPVAANVQNVIFTIPWFKHFRKKFIEECAGAFRKVIENYKDLLADDYSDTNSVQGSYSLSFKRVI
jgi:dTDP-4-amino-4,6-dideoxygalactose transaminase